MNDKHQTNPLFIVGDVLVFNARTNQLTNLNVIDEETTRRLLKSQLKITTRQTSIEMRSVGIKALFKIKMPTPE